MFGTRPTLYLVPLPRALGVELVTGQHPETPTEVLKCVAFLGQKRRSNEGRETS